MTLAMARPVWMLVANGVPTVFGPSSQPLKNRMSDSNFLENFCFNCKAIRSAPYD